MSEVEIQEVRDVDAVWRDLVALSQGLYAHHAALGAPPLVADWQRRWRAHLGGSGERLILIGRVDGAAAGLVNTRIQRTSGIYQEAFAFLEDAFVVPEQRGSGLIQEMLGRTEGWCRSRGIDVLRLSVLAANSLAVHFWEKSGFQPFMQILSKDLNP